MCKPSWWQKFERKKGTQMTFEAELRATRKQTTDLAHCLCSKFIGWSVKCEHIYLCCLLSFAVASIDKNEERAYLVGCWLLVAVRSALHCISYNIYYIQILFEFMAMHQHLLCSLNGNVNSTNGELLWNDAIFFFSNFSSLLFTLLVYDMSLRIPCVLSMGMGMGMAVCAHLHSCSLSFECVDMNAYYFRFVYL